MHTRRVQRTGSHSYVIITCGNVGTMAFHVKIAIDVVYVFTFFSSCPSSNRSLSLAILTAVVVTVRTAALRTSTNGGRNGRYVWILFTSLRW